MKVSPFRKLLTEAQHKGRDPDEPPRSLDELAKKCQVDRTHLWKLATGQVDPSLMGSWTIHRLARGLDIDTDALRAVLVRTAEGETVAVDDEPKVAPRKRRPRSSSMLD